MRTSILRINYLRLIFISLLTGAAATLLAFALKKITEMAETAIFGRAHEFPLLFILLPPAGITAIYFLRKHLFKGKSNKGIKEIFRTLKDRTDELPFYKIPSHFINGFLTVITGGSTGVEVSTVVATAAIGAAAYKKEKVARALKTEIICAGVAAGIATLFNSPLAGLLFAIEVIAGRVNRSILISCLAGVAIPALLLFLPGEHALFAFTITKWNLYALPYFGILAAFSAVVAVYFTRIVIYIKKKFYAINSNFIRVNAGALAVGTGIYFLPQLFGDSYHSISGLVAGGNTSLFSAEFVILLMALVLLKPLAASLTLGAGGDGGVFAPSIVTGAIAGILVAVLANQFFNAHLIVINFALAGAAAALSAAIHAPLTALFIGCNMMPGGYILFLPLLLCTFVSRYISQWLCGYTVYSYDDREGVMFPHLRVKQLIYSAFRKTV